MKQWKIIIIFSVLLALLIGTLVVTSLLKKDSDTNIKVSPTPAVDPVLAVEEKDVSTITIENTKEKLVIVPGTAKDESGNDKTTWNLSYPENLAYSSDVISQKISSYTQITADIVIGTSGLKLSEYGLDKPVASITVLLKSGQKKRVIYGNETASPGTRYIMLEGSNRVCTTASYNYESAIVTSLDFMDSNVLNGLTVADLKTLDFERSRDGLVIKAISNNDAAKDGSTPATWQITAPIKIEANAEGFTKLLDQVSQIKAESFIELAPKDMSKYGLDKPKYTLRYKGDKHNISLILGGDAGNGSLYGYSDYVRAVFVVGSASLNLIDKPFVELVNSFVHMASIWEVKSIDISIDSEKIHCDIKDSQDKETESDFRVNGKDANVTDSSDDSYFRGFYQSVISIFIKGVDTAVKPPYTPSITISYVMNDAKKNIILDFVKRDDLTYYVFKDKIYQGYYVSKDDFYSQKVDDEGILPAYKILDKAIQNQVGGKYQ